jgi:hypothetical protein
MGVNLKAEKRLRRACNETAEDLDSALHYEAVLRLLAPVAIPDGRSPQLSFFTPRTAVKR